MTTPLLNVYVKLNDTASNIIILLVTNMYKWTMHIAIPMKYSQHSGMSRKQFEKQTYKRENRNIDVKVAQSISCILFNRYDY